MKEEISMLLAKSQENGGTSLLDHSLSVARECALLMSYIAEEPRRKELATIAYLSGLLHDIGKSTLHFQNRLAKTEDDGDFQFHHMIGAKFVQFRIDKGKMHSDLFRALIRSILYHHPINMYDSSNKKLDMRDFDYEDFSSVIEEDDIATLESITKCLLDKYETSEYYNKDFNISLSRPNNSSMDLSHFTNDKNCFEREEHIYYVLTNVLRYADAKVSAMENGATTFPVYDELKYGELYANIRKPDGYDDRFDIQMDMAEKLSIDNVTAFSSQTGFGKTMLGILYLLKNRRKGYWICPRNTIATSIYESVKKELIALGMGDKVRVALLLTNEFKEGDNDCDIIVTNIDNFTRPSLKSDCKHRCYDIAYCNVIFDEFHEYITDEAIMAIFDLMIKSRYLLNTRTLLLSATTIDNFYRLPDENGVSNNIKEISYDCANILDRKVKIFFDTQLPNKIKGNDWLIGMQSISQTQKLFDNGDFDNIFHADYFENDKKSKLISLFNGHSKKSVRDNTSWINTNVISTGIDVSFKNMALNLPTPERMLQMGGRCNRWNEFESENEKPVWYLVNDTTSSEVCALKTYYSKDLYDKFYNELKQMFQNGQIVTLGELYLFRRNFYRKYKKEWNAFFNEKKRSSYASLHNIDYSRVIKPKETQPTRLSNKASIRNDGNVKNYFIRVTNEKDNRFYEDVLQVRQEKVRDFIDVQDKFDKNMLKAIKPNYANSPYRFKQIAKKNKRDLQKYVLEHAISEDTPIMVYDTYYYNPVKGLYKI